MNFKIGLCLIGSLLAGCMLDTGSTYKSYKINTKPYTVNGTTYYPMASANGFTETGEASWYGPGFHGKKTASGERYNQNAFTAAHKTLPFGTRLRVTNLSNGLSTTVVVNDRGPFKKGRIIDLSNAAAKQINMIGTGTTRVRIKSIGSTNVAQQTSVAKTSASSSYGIDSNTYYIQIGAFSSRDNANNAAQQLSNRGYNYRIKSGSGGTYTVQAGPYSSRSKAESVRDTLRRSYSGAFITE